MIIAFSSNDDNGYIYTVGGVFESWSSKDVRYYVTSRRNSACSNCTRIDCIIDCLSMVNFEHIDTILMYGFVWISDDGKEIQKGFGAKLHEAIRHRFNREVAIVGMSKCDYFVKIPHSVEIKRGNDGSSLYITCSDVNSTKNYAILVKMMDGEDKLPTVMNLVNSKLLDLKDKMKEEEDVHHHENINLNMEDIDKWADETFSMVEKNGFRYK